MAASEKSSFPLSNKTIEFLKKVEKSLDLARRDVHTVSVTPAPGMPVWVSGALRRYLDGPQTMLGGLARESEFSELPMNTREFLVSSMSNVDELLRIITVLAERCLELEKMTGGEVG